MIRFSASLVVIALGLLAVGGITSKLVLVYLAIAVSAVALVFLLIGAILNRADLRAPVVTDPDADSAPPATTDTGSTTEPGGITDTGSTTDAGSTTEPGGTTHTEYAGDTKDTTDVSGTKDAEVIEDTRHAEGPTGTGGIERTGGTGGTGGTERTGGTGGTGGIERTGGTGGIERTGGTGGVQDAGDVSPAGQVVTVVPGLPRYHRSECLLIRFMGGSDLQTMPVEAAREAGCTPCRACHPDGGETD